jgi:hypothetical protein
MSVSVMLCVYSGEGRDVLYNKTFSEELIAYFPWYDTGHIENDATNNSSIVACAFITAVTFLPSRCSSNDKGIFTEPLPSNDRGDTVTHTDRNVIS